MVSKSEQKCPSADQSTSPDDGFDNVIDDESTREKSKIETYFSDEPTEDVKPTDSISQIGGVDDDDDASVAPTLVAPSLSTKPKKYTSTGEICFSFGPNGYYFVFSTNGQVLVRTATVSPTLGFVTGKKTMSHVYMHSFSPHGDEFLLYENHDTNAVTWLFHQDAGNTTITYRTLRDWLVKNLNVQSKDDLLKSRVVFGPGASFYASNGKICLYHDLPTSLSEAIEKNLENGALPDILSLGAQDTFFARWPDGTGLWQLNIESRLHKKLSPPDFSLSIFAYIFLDPVDTKRFVTVAKTGMVEYQVLDNDGNVGAQLKAYMQIEAKKTGTTFHLEFTKGKNLKDQEVSYISPDTNYALPGLDSLKKAKQKESKEEAASSPTKDMAKDEEKDEGVEEEAVSSATKKKSRFSLFSRKQ